VASRSAAALATWVEPMKPPLTDKRFIGEAWTFERKLDGISVLAFKRPNARSTSGTGRTTASPSRKARPNGWQGVGGVHLHARVSSCEDVGHAPPASDRGPPPYAPHDGGVWVDASV
jgi:hypothetical protein